MYSDICLSLHHHERQVHPSREYTQGKAIPMHC